MIVRAFKKGKEVSTVNLSGDTRVVYRCDDCGAEHETSWYALKHKDRIDTQYCRKCTIKRNDVVDKRKATCIEKYGADNPMKVKELADKHHKFDTQKGTRTDFDLIKKSFADEGYTLLATEYTNRTQQLDFICPNGHEHHITWSSWRRGSRCLLCSYIENGINRRHSIEFVREEFKKDGYELLSTEYINKHQYLRYKCPKGHTGNIQFGNWLHNGTRCSSCAHHISRAEIEIYDLIKSHFPDAISGDRKIIAPLELDIVIPSKKIAIEYCGLYWHSEAQGKNKDYHLDKLVKCNSVGYRLITIFEDEWVSKKDIVISRLLHNLGISDAPRIHARKCEIREIDAKLKNKFLTKYHVQGKDSASIKLGAFYKDELVSVMTFSKPNISRRSKYEWELNRFVSGEYRVPGIASKLFSYFIKNWQPKDMVTYSDRRWSGDAFYDKLGFKLLHNSKPNYWYIIEDRRLHRYNFRKSMLHKKLDNFDPSLTEVQNMTNNQITRIFDCGNGVWTWNNLKENSL